jgi:translocation and assembly module TamA
MPLKSRFRTAFAAVFCCVMAGGATAQDVTLTAPGASDDLLDRLRANALLLRAPEDGAARSGQDIIAAARADYGRLIGILYEESYFAPVIRILLDGQDAGRISPFNAPTDVQTVTITVETGPAFRLGQAEIGPLAPNTELPEGFVTGQPATTPLLRATTTAALDGWRMRGHATADVATQRITANHREAVLNADISIAPGPVVTFGNLLPAGQERMRIARIIEIAGLPTGDIYSPDALARSEERLRDTGVFAAVSLAEQSPGPGDVMDIAATLDEAPLRRLGFGFELSSDDGIGVSGYWLHRNLFGGAERLRFDGAISGISIGDDSPDIELSARLDRPATLTADTTLGLELDAIFLDEPQFQLTGIGGLVSLSHQINRTLSANVGVGLSYNRIEDAFGTRNVSLLTLPVGVTYDNRDDPLDARAGAFAEASLTPFLPFGGSGGGRFYVDGRAYYGFGEADRTRFAARVQIGSIAGADITDIPPDFLFFSGGSGTVRGQDFQSLGAVQNGVDAGGRGFLGLSGELRHDIGDTSFGIVGFADLGMITADAFGSGSSDFHAGAGVGLRYATPFGPIRVDLATPVSGDSPASQLFLYIGIGQSF